MTLEGHEDDVTSVAISTDNKIVASGSKDKTLKLWELATGKLISTVNHDEKVRAIAFCFNSYILATGCDRGNIRLFKPQLKPSNSLQELLN